MRLLKEERRRRRALQFGGKVIIGSSDHAGILFVSIEFGFRNFIILDGYCNDPLSRSIRITCANDTNKRRKKE